MAKYFNKGDKNNFNIMGDSGAKGKPINRNQIGGFLVLWSEQAGEISRRLKDVGVWTDYRGNALRFGIRLHSISRDRSKDAWAETERFLEQLDRAAE